MLPPDSFIRAVARRAGLVLPLPRYARRNHWHPKRVVAFPLLVLTGVTLAQAGGTVLLSRKYRAGQAMVYRSKVETNSKVDSDPPGLKSFLPPMPTNLRMSQQSTVTVSSVHPDGGADVQHRFDKFDIQSDLTELPENIPRHDHPSPGGSKPADGG